MKRCPKCEFIYEDDQSLCDMDGVLLVFDTRKLPNLYTAKTATKRNRAVPAFATVILALVLGLVYYVSVHRRATQNSYTPPPPSAASTTTNVNPTPEAQLPAAGEPKPEPPKPTAPVAAAPAPVKKAAVTKPAPEPAKSKVEEKKDESKVNSILKKTGRILKKPFKF